MKNKIFNLYEKIQKLTFFQGVALTLCLTSLVSIAATNFSGFFVFTPGTPISSSEINANFEKIGGTVVYKAIFSNAFSVDQNSLIVPTDCPTCNVYRKKILFTSVTAGTSTTTTDSDANNASNNSNFSYFTVPSEGWYEVRFLGDLSTSITSPNCSGTSCQMSVSAGAGVYIAGSLALAQAGGNNSSIAWQGNNKNLTDNNYDNIFDPPNYWPGSLGEAKKFYLKAGQVVYVRFEGNGTITNATGDINLGANSLDLTIIKF